MQNIVLRITFPFCLCVNYSTLNLRVKFESFYNVNVTKFISNGKPIPSAETFWQYVEYFQSAEDNADTIEQFIENQAKTQNAAKSKP